MFPDSPESDNGLFWFGLKSFYSLFSFHPGLVATSPGSTKFCAMKDRISIGIVNETAMVQLQNLEDSAIDLTQIICESLESLCIFEIASTNEYGSIDSTGNWTGVLSLINQGLYNTSLPNYKATVSRASQFDFPRTGFDRNVNFYTRAADYWSGNEKGLLDPWKREVWVALLLCLIAMSLVIFVSETLGSFNVRAKPYTHLTIFLQKIVEIFLTLAVFLVRKNLNKKFLHKAVQLLLIAWGLSSLILISSYTALLLRSMIKLTEPKPFKDLVTLVDCIKKQTCSLIVAPGSETFLKEVFDSQVGWKYFPLKMTLQNENPLIRTTSLDQMIRLIVETKDKFLVSWPTSKNLFAYVESECLLQAIQLGSEIRTFPFRQNDTLKTRFEETIEIMRETGWIVRSERRAFELKERKCRVSKKPSLVSPLSLSSCISIVIMINYCFLIATGAFISEWLSNTNLNIFKGQTFNF